MIKNRIIKIGTDFSGIGSPEQAIKNLGIKHSVEFSCEIDKHARKSYQEIHKTKKMYDDVTKRDHSKVKQLDLYVAGFPCQSFSIAGKRQGFEDVRGTLFFNVVDFIKINQPKAFILENVRGLLSHDSGRTFQTIIDLLSNGGGTVNGQMSFDFFDDGLGYHIHHKILNSKEHGIPQNRERVFILGFKDARSYNFPKTETLELRLKDLLEETVDEKYFLSDKAIKSIIENPKNQQKSKLNPEIAATLQAPGKSCGVYKGMNAVSLDWVADYRNDEGLRKRKDKISPCIATRKHSETDISTMPPIIQTSQAELIRLEDIPLKATKRKHDTPVAINKYLKKHKIGTNKEIAEKLDVPKTQVDHYFRIDKFRAVPSLEDWKKLKKLFGFDDKYDKEVTEINETEYSFESSKRLYSADGIAQTLDTSAPGFYEVPVDVKDDELIFLGGTKKHNRGEGNLSRDYSKQDRIYDSKGLAETITSQEWTLGNYKVNSQIRRLTPLECWRLQGFPDEAFFKAQKVNSDIQLYRQAGNSITVNVIQKIIYNIFN